MNNRNLAMIVLLAAFPSATLAQQSALNLYSAKCKICHGADGTGHTLAGKMTKVISFKDTAVVKASDEALMAVIKNGKNKMPTFAGQLNDPQIRSLISYIRTLQK